MTEADIPAVVAIDRRSFPVPWSERSYRFELLENPAALLLVAEATAEPGRPVVGYVGLWLLGEEAHISTLAVDPAYRRRGIGRRLLRAALERAAAAGAQAVTLEVRVSNAAAIALYRSFGFQEVGVRRGYYRDNGEDALLMTWYREKAAQEPQGGER